MASARILPKVGPTVTMSRSLATTRNVPRTAFLYYQCRGPGTYQAPFPECHGQRRGEIYSAVPWTWVAISAALVGVACAISSHDPAAPRRSNLISHVLGTRPVELSFEKYPDSIQQDRDNLEALLHILFPPHSFRIYLDDAKDGHHIPPGTTTPQRASPEPIALYRVEERAGATSTRRGGDVIALGLYVYAGVDSTGEEKILAEATRAKTQQGRAALGAPMKTISFWGGQPQLGIMSMSMRMGERWIGERPSRVDVRAWGEHFGRLGWLERGEGMEGLEGGGGGGGGGGGDGRLGGSGG